MSLFTVDSKKCKHDGIPQHLVTAATSEIMK